MYKIAGEKKINKSAMFYFLALNSGSVFASNDIRIYVFRV